MSTGKKTEGFLAGDFPFDRADSNCDQPAEALFPGMGSGELAALLAPSKMVGKETTIEAGGVRAAGCVIQDFRPHQPAMVHRLASLPGGWTRTVYM